MDCSGERDGMVLWNSHEPNVLVMALLSYWRAVEDSYFRVSGFGFRVSGFEESA